MSIAGIIINFVRGFCMALADSVPGVSGGTIAFLLGFYDRFIGSLDDLFHGPKAAKIDAVKFLLKLGFGWIVGFGLSALVLTSFGYLQHLVSFSSIASNGSPGGVIVQVARGIAAILMFGIVCIAPQRASAVYRVGLLAMIAGFMMMSFLFGSELFWIAGAVIISGYTAFDLLVWVVFSQIAHTQSRDPLKTIAAVRLLAVVCYVVGALAGILLVGNDQSMHAFVFQETTAIGYLVVIATVLLLSSEDIWMLFGYTARAGSANQEGIGQEERLAAWFDRIGLTARERDIASLLAAGRTQPWIADCLSISENTVGTHVRHIYQKADVHNRQEFIDRAISPDHPASPESRDHVSNVTDVA